jgi:hypothetical protein
MDSLAASRSQFLDEPMNRYDTAAPMITIA